MQIVVRLQRGGLLKQLGRNRIVTLIEFHRAQVGQRPGIGLNRQGHVERTTGLGRVALGQIQAAQTAP
ncbi:hypothetical protein D3C71_986930 [compost metagenome]